MAATPSAPLSPSARAPAIGNRRTRRLTTTKQETRRDLRSFRRFQIQNKGLEGRMGPYALLSFRVDLTPQIAMKTKAEQSGGNNVGFAQLRRGIMKFFPPYSSGSPSTAGHPKEVSLKSRRCFFLCQLFPAEKWEALSVRKGKMS